MTTQLPGKYRFQVGIILVTWAIIAPDPMSYWVIGVIVATGSFLVADGLWAAMGVGR